MSLNIGRPLLERSNSTSSVGSEVSSLNIAGTSAANVGSVAASGSVANAGPASGPASVANAGSASAANAGPVSAAAAGSASADLENNELNVSKMSSDQMKQYVLDDGEEITDLAFKKVKEKFLNDYPPNNSIKHEEENKLNGYTTISQVQEAERKLDEEISVLQKTFSDAKEMDPNARKTKGHANMELQMKERYASLLKPVLHVLESKMKATNTLQTILPNDALERKRQKVIAIKQYAQEIKEVVDGALTIIIADADLKKHQGEIKSIVDKMQEESSSNKITNSTGTPLLNRMKKEDGPIDVTVPIKDTNGKIYYSSYQMENGKFSKVENIKDNTVVEQKFSDAIQSAKEGTKVVKMTYKGEPLIVSLNISHPNDSKEKAKLNMNSALKKEAERIVPAFTKPGTNMEEPGTNQNVSKLSNNQLSSAKTQIEKDIAFVNTNTKVLPQNKAELKNVITRTRLQPIDAEIVARRLKKESSKGGSTAKKSKKNNKTKKSTRRSS